MTDSYWDVCRSILERALELPAEERHSFIKEATGADSRLRHDVLSLLADRAPVSTLKLPSDEGGPPGTQSTADGELIPG